MSDEYKIRFNKLCEGEGYKFQAGSTQTMSHASCHRWVRRAVADYVGQRPPEESPKVTAAKPEAMGKVRFTEDRSGDGYDFKAGKSYDLSMASCRRWVRRQAAVYTGSLPLEAAVVRHVPYAPVPDMEPEKKRGVGRPRKDKLEE